MRRPRKNKRRGISPAAAVGMLVVCAGIAFFSLRSQMGGAGGFADSENDSPFEDPQATAVVAGLDEPGVDLLLGHGSWSAAEPVRMAFANLAEAAIAAAPMVETASVSRQWVGADPPQLHLGVLMVGSAARRAVVDGRVVGLGDNIGRALVVAIERDVLVTTWGGKRLTYDLDDEYPREFRAERKRRGIDQKAASDRKAAGQIQENEQ